VVNHQKNLAEEVAAIGFPKGVHYVYCCVDINKNWDAIVAVTRCAGKIIGITGWAGLDMTKVPGKRLTVVAELMFARSGYDEEPELQHQILARVGQLLDAGILTHLQNHHYEWHQIKEAQEFQDGGKAIGKITLTVKF